MTVRNCVAQTRSGKECKAPPLTGSAFCFQHDESVTEKRDEARRRGGRNSGKLARLERVLGHNPSLKNVVDVLAEVTESVRAGATSPSVGNSVASLSRALVAALEAADANARLKDLEEVIDRLIAGEQDNAKLRAVS